jgi:16S rRNA A1518/A1519 N6-dimethyltransferase RsmA/KsgA/DIM1 with predicted DNA glycosylase/AP lyase activity
MKFRQIYNFILTGSPEEVGDDEEESSKKSALTSSSKSSSSSSSQVEEKEEEDEEIEEVGSKNNKRKVFLYNKDFLDSPVKDRSVDLLITDIPYNVSSIFF